MSAGNDFATYWRVRDTRDRSGASVADFATPAADFATEVGALHPHLAVDRCRPDVDGEVAPSVGQVGSRLAQEGLALLVRLSIGGPPSASTSRSAITSAVGQAPTARRAWPVGAPMKTT